MSQVEKRLNLRMIRATDRLRKSSLCSVTNNAANLSSLMTSSPRSTLRGNFGPHIFTKHLAEEGASRRSREIDRWILARSSSA